jgi:hypothetical protein
VVDDPAFTPKQDMNTTVAIADPDMADLPDPLFNDSLAGATRFVVIG